MTLILRLLAIFSLGMASASAQHASPYADLQTRTIKALSDQQIGDLRSGRGMGLALAAELNGYPGPLHVIELATELGLSTEQRQRMQTLFAEMKLEASALGEQLISEEAMLDRLFAGREINAQLLVATTNKIGATQAALRAAHLKYHLATVEVLSPEQVRKYAHLRGYHGAKPKTEHKHQH
jgi:Spy/CpxP family protein refolding chaperone